MLKRLLRSDSSLLARCVLPGLAVLLALAPAVRAGTGGMITPFFRGATNTLFSGWDNFTWAYETNNLPSIAGSTGSAAISQADTNAFITGTFNLYNLASNSLFTLTDSTPYTLGTVVLQVRALGAELDYNSVRLQYTNGSGTQLLAAARVELLRANVGLATVVSMWEWNVAGLGLTNYSIVFNAAGSSLSFDSAMLDTRAAVPAVEKMADFRFLDDEDAYYPLDRFTQHGTNLWFTTERGGTPDAGTISRYDLVTREIVPVAELGNASGYNPDGGILIIGDEGFFTTKNGGAGDRGTIAKFSLTNGAVTTLFDFPTNGANYLGSTPRGGLTLIGDDLFCTTSAGGSNGMGTILRFSLLSNAVVQAHHFDGAATGRQPYDNFAKVGGDYYFTTFTGGTNTGTGVGNGAGTLGKMSFDSASNMVVTKVLDLPIGYTQFPASSPVLVGTNTLYFTTVGPNPSPGAIVRYTIDTGVWTNAFTFITNIFHPAQHGKQPGYNGLTQWGDDLYFMTRQGGLSNLGVVAKFNLTSNTVTKLADLIGMGATSLGSGNGGYNSGTIVEENVRAYMYFPTSRGGVNAGTGVTAGAGTVIRAVLPAAPVQLSLTRSATNALTLSWTGGYAPFTVQARANVANDPWTIVAGGLTNRSLTLTNLSSRAFLRVSGQ